MTPRENMEAMFRHEPMEYVPNLWKDCYVMRDSCVERPMNYTGKDAWGLQWIAPEQSANITHPDVSDIKFTEIEEWREKAGIPDLSKVDYSECDAAYAGYTDEVRKDKMLFFISLNGIFERSHLLMGFENALCAAIIDPDEYGEMIKAFADHKIRSLDIFCDKYAPEIILYHDDMGTQTGPFFDVEFYEKYLFPQYKRIVDHLHSRGVKHVVHHSCGKIDPLIDSWKSCGFDGLDSLMPCNDLPEIQKKLGKDYVLWPGGDNQDVLGIAGIEKRKIEEMVIRYFNIFGRDATGFAMDTTFAYSINRENDDYCYQMELKHGKAFFDAMKAGKEYIPVYEPQC